MSASAPPIPEGRGCLTVNAAAELVSADPDLGPVLAETILGSVDRVQALLDGAREAGELPADCDTAALALSIQTLMIGISTLSKVVREEEKLWSAAEITLAGLGLLDTGAGARERA